MKYLSDQRPTLADVARRAGYSPSTVSRALKDDPRVKADTKNKIRAIANELGFSQNAAARSLRRGGSSSLIGLIVPNVLDPFYAAVVTGVQEAAFAESREVIVACHQERDAMQELVVQQMLQHRVEAILIVPVTEQVSPILRAESKFGTVIVALDRPISGFSADYITTANHSGASQLVAALIKAGHKRIAAVSLSPEIYTQKIRLEAAHQTVRETSQEGVTLEVIHTDHQGNLDPDEMDARLLEIQPTAVFSTAVIPLIGVLESMRRTGMHLQLASFDSHPVFEILNEPILSVEQDPVEIGRTAIKLVQHRLQQPQSPPRVVELPLKGLRELGGVR